MWNPLNSPDPGKFIRISGVIIDDYWTYPYDDIKVDVNLERLWVGRAINGTIEAANTGKFVNNNIGKWFRSKNCDLE